MNGEPFPYEDIVELPHHVSATRAPMPLRDRAAQFASFSPLAGYDDAIEEAARQTEYRLSLDENELAILDRRLAHLASRLDQKPMVEIECFVDDRRKPGGSYRTLAGRLVAISVADRTLVLDSGAAVAVGDIIAINVPDGDCI